VSVLRPSAEEPLPVPEQPTRSLTPRAWARENLFSGPVNTAVTILFGLLLAWVAYRAIWFVFVDARWEIVERNIENLLVFRYPRDELWRLWGALFVLAGGLGLAAGIGSRGSLHASPLLALRRAGPMLALVAVLLAFAGSLTATLLVVAITALAVGARLLGSRLPVRGRWAPAVALGSVLAAYLLVAHFGGVGWEDWGGLQLTLFLAVGGIVLSFPLGVLLALGRRSRLPAVRWVCVAYIELIRGVPLITILFMGAFMLGFFLPEGVETPSAVTRALIAFTIFTSAYVAEIVRGGLQSVPRGQIEAAQALGLSTVKTTRLIVLPQALRAVIPALVGQFISLFKDTSLVFIIGLTELLAVAEAITKQPDFLAQGLLVETLLFVGFVYWAGSYWMSRESQRLERRLGVGER
jgi:general L-amino acid transport system permease protein